MAKNTINSRMAVRVFSESNETEFAGLKVALCNDGVSGSGEFDEGGDGAATSAIAVDEPGPCC